MRYAGREDLGRIGLFTTYFAPLGLHEPDVMSLLEILEFECQISTGLMRPDDPVWMMASPVKSRYLLGRVLQVTDDVRSGDIELALGEGLRRRLGIRPRFCAPGPRFALETFGDLVHLWCGDRSYARG
jgi:hypothetical protein